MKSFLHLQSFNQDAPSSNWQDSGFWYRQSRFESLWGNIYRDPKRKLGIFYLQKFVELARKDLGK